MKVSDILRVKGGTLYTVAPETSLNDAIKTMAGRDIGSLVVMSHGELVGMLTFREVIQAIVANDGSVVGGEQDDITFWSFLDAQPDDADRLRPTGPAASGAADPKAISHAGHRDQLADFLRAIDAGEPARVDGREGRKAVEIIRAIYRSARLDRPVALPLGDDPDLGPA